ncbi:MAG: lytic transglycosylase domain-containing protein [Candidatus Baltobacteraceae bacterium]|jgi:type IV secretion system protein VirB1
MLIPITLAGLLTSCAPHVGPVTMGAIVAYESGARPYAIGDNTAQRSFFPTSRANAEELASQLLGEGHNIDVGYAQVNSVNFAPFGLTVHAAFEPCTNITVGSSILRRAYAGAVRRYGPGQVALFHALSAYNTGGYWAGQGYARGVYATARTLRWSGRESTP